MSPAWRSIAWRAGSAGESDRPWPSRSTTTLVWPVLWTERRNGAQSVPRPVKPWMNRTAGPWPAVRTSYVAPATVDLGHEVSSDGVAGGLAVVAATAGPA